MASVIDILLRAKNAASGGINQVTHSLKELDNAAGKASQGLNGVAALAGVAGFGLLAQQIGEAGKSAAELERLRLAYDALATSAGSNSAEMINAIKDASGGAISEYDAMLSANRAMLLEVADTTEEMTSLVEIAVARGRAMGLSTEQAFNDIVTGLGRMSPLILDNLGIVINAEKTMKDYAESIGKGVDELTDAERKQALLNATIASSKSLIDASKSGLYDSANAYERVAVGVDELKRALGELANEAFLQTGAETASGRLSLYTTMFERWGKSAEEQLPLVRQQIADTEVAIAQMDAIIEGSGNAAEKAWARFEKASLNATKANLEAWVASKEGVLDFSHEIGRAAIETEKASMRAMRLADSASEAGTSLYESATAAANAAHEYGYLGSVAISAAGDIDSLKSSVLGLKSALAGVDAQFEQVNKLRDSAGQKLLSSALEAAQYVGTDQALAMYEASAAALWDQASAIKATNMTTTEQIFAMNELGEATIAPFENIVDAGEEMKRLEQKTGGATSATKSLTSEYSDLKNAVSGVISGIFDGDTAGIKAEDLLPREDAIDENARRLADIAVNGFKGQEWLGEFAEEVPAVFDEIATSADPKGTAARILKDFQDGLRPELIDKDRAKDLVRRALLGDQQTQQLINEIAQELSQEMGIAMYKVQGVAGDVLGGGGSGSGSSAPKELEFKTVVNDTEIEELKQKIQAPDGDGWTITVSPQLDVSSEAVDYTSAVTTMTEALPLMLTPFIDVSPTALDYETLRTTMTEALPLKLTPWIETTGEHIDNARTTMTEALALKLTPWIEINMDDVATARTTINEALAVKITPWVDTESQYIQAQGLKLTDALLAGMSVTEGMADVATPIITAISTQFIENYEQLANLGGLIGLGILSSLTEQNLGLAIANVISGGINDNLDAIGASGKTAGKGWGDMFLEVVGENVPFSLIQILADLVTPEVIEQMNSDRGGSR